MSNLLVASPFTGQLRNFSFAPCQPGDARQSEKPGHPIAFGPMPIGPAILEPVAMTASPEPWVVTKISNSADLREFRG